MTESSALAAYSRFVFASQDRQRMAQALLQSWFEKGWNRKTTPTVNPTSEEDLTVSMWCLRVFKRGFLQVQTEPEDLVPRFDKISSDDLLRLVLAKLQNGKMLLIIDTGFLKNWPKWAKALEGIGSVLHYEPSEETKTLETIGQWASVILSRCQNSPKETAFEEICSVGGGITSDMGGFLAGLFDLQHHSCPTTLLSASDASVGGKTGVNFKGFGKNQIGLFYPTTEWWVSAEHFLTLGPLEIISGLAETLKHMWIMGVGPESSEFQALGRILQGIQTNKPLVQDDLTVLVSFNFRAKAAVVKADPLENGPRKFLNLGHTLAHVIEGLGEAKILPKVPHGLAVALGMQYLIDSGAASAPPHLSGIFTTLIEAAAIKLPLAPVQNLGNAPGQLERVFCELALQDKKSEESELSAVTLIIAKFGQCERLLNGPPDTSPDLTYVSHRDTIKIPVRAFFQSVKKSNIIG